MPRLNERDKIQGIIRKAQCMPTLFQSDLMTIITVLCLMLYLLCCTFFFFGYFNSIRVCFSCSSPCILFHDSMVVCNSSLYVLLPQSCLFFFLLLFFSLKDTKVHCVHFFLSYTCSYFVMQYGGGVGILNKHTNHISSTTQKKIKIIIIRFRWKIEENSPLLVSY
jgi:hypothetical protein